MPTKIIPIEIEGINDKIYSGFWSRLGANLLDGLIIMPISILILVINSIDMYTYFYTIVPDLLFIFWYNIYLPKRYGGTPGKLIVGLKIVKLDSSPIDWKESFLRFSVNTIFIIITIAMEVMAIISADAEIYNDLDWLQKSQYLSGMSVAYIITVLSNIWIWSEVIVLLFNKRKRAIHDFIAGTVVVKSKYIDKIREKMESD
jgi:uncharacterized RDD family membrane protein YckC